MVHERRRKWPRWSPSNTKHKIQNQVPKLVRGGTVCTRPKSYEYMLPTQSHQNLLYSFNFNLSIKRIHSQGLDMDIRFVVLPMPHLRINDNIIEVGWNIVLRLRAPLKQQFGFFTMGKRLIHSMLIFKSQCKRA